MSLDARQREIDRNFDFFLSQFRQLDEGHRGEYVLLRHQQIIGFYDRVEDAASDAQQRFGDHLYSIQIVEPEPVDLGFVTRA
ncbi:hypothetical protein [Sandarakinorhabdus sp.]|uniref:hypothetical protein n=1 Tax=Sandarakinorhabdus sp. TaxID=1916663 RepID=UPI00286DFBC1|nr:hypothetical protein [Sandarakinorhabdus sp.]